MHLSIALCSRCRRLSIVATVSWPCCFRSNVPSCHAVHLCSIFHASLSICKQSTDGETGISLPYHASCHPVLLGIHAGAPYAHKHQHSAARHLALWGPRGHPKCPHQHSRLALPQQQQQQQQAMPYSSPGPAAMPAAPPAACCRRLRRSHHPAAAATCRCASSLCRPHLPPADARLSST